MVASTDASSVFLSTPSARRATGRRPKQRSGRIFLSTPSARATTICGRRWPPRRFLSTPSAEGDKPFASQQDDQLISIHALREEGDADFVGHLRAIPLISIHALREEGDRPNDIKWDTKRISIHALREGDLDRKPTKGAKKIFLSTPSARGRRSIGTRIDAITLFLSTPSARRATHPNTSCILAS